MIRSLFCVSAAIAVLLVGAGAAAATDDYTLPFYDPGVALSYGVDRDPRVGVQLDYTGKTLVGRFATPGPRLRQPHRPRLPHAAALPRCGGEGW